MINGNVLEAEVSQEAVLARAAQLGRKFTADDIQGDLVLIRTASDYAMGYSGQFEFMLRMKRTLQSLGSIRVQDVAGILNCLVYDREQDRRRMLYLANREAPPNQPAGPVGRILVDGVRSAQPAQPSQPKVREPEKPVSRQELARSYEELFPDEANPAAQAATEAPEKDSEREPVHEIAAELAAAPTPPEMPDFYEPTRYSGVPSGTYTLVFEDDSYVTLRVEDIDEEQRARLRENYRMSLAPGAQLIGYLNGPDNWRNYKNIGTFSDGELRIWKKHQHLTTQIAAVNALFTADRDTRNAYGVSYAKASGKCFLCNRKLTTPQSLAQGYGPICAEKL